MSNTAPVIADPWQAIFTIDELEYLADLFAGANDPRSAAIGDKAQTILESIGRRELLNPRGTPTTLSELSLRMILADPTNQPLTVEARDNR